LPTGGSRIQFGALGLRLAAYFHCLAPNQNFTPNFGLIAFCQHFGRSPQGQAGEHLRSPKVVYSIKFNEETADLLVVIEGSPNGAKQAKINIPPCSADIQ